MEQNIITSVFLPLALGIIMRGLGLSLTTSDFSRVLVYPKAVFTGLLCQMFLLPAVCVVVIKLFGLSPELAVGLMLLAASPGGATANLFSHIAKGDVALNITLTAINSVLSLFTLPFIVNWSLSYFQVGVDKYVPMQVGKTIEVCAIVLIPVCIGMFIRSKNLKLSESLAKPVKILSAVFLVLVILSALLKEKANLGSYFQQVGMAALAFNVASLAVGYLIPRIIKLDSKQSTAIGMEVGIHNGTLAILIAGKVLENNMMSIPPAIYSLIMFLTASAFGYWASRRNSAVV